MALDAELVAKAREVAKKRGMTLQTILLPLISKALRDMSDE
jgi:hypothetical protein